MKKLFIKEFNLPIPTYESPAFEYFVEIYGYQELWEKISKANREEFYQDRAKILDYLKGSEIYQKFKEDPEIMSLEFKENVGNLYTQENVGKIFTSIDLREANFQALYWYGFFDGYTGWKDFVSSMSSNPILLESKRSRQVVLGKLGTTRQTRIERYLLGLLEDSIGTTAYIRNNDELIYPGVLECPGSTLRLKVDTFTLKDITLYTPSGEKIVGYVKERPSGELTLHKIPLQYHAQFWKHCYNSTLNPEYDLLFTWEGQLCKFLTPLCSK